MAAWDGYIDSIVGGSQGSCDKACIIGLVGGGSWTTNAHPQAINLMGNEGATIANALLNEDYSTFQQKGIMVEGVKFQFLRQDDNTSYGKKKDNGCLTMQKTKTAIVIAHTKEGSQHGNTNKSVDGIVNYLETSGL